MNDTAVLEAPTLTTADTCKRLRDIISVVCKKYDTAIRSAKSNRVALALLRDKKRYLCHYDLFYLGRITGHTFWKPGDIKGFVDPFHKDICDKVSLLSWQLVEYNLFPKPQFPNIPSMPDLTGYPLGKKRRLFLCFRSAYKTTIVSKLGILQLLLNFPNIHIALAHNTIENASTILEAIKDLFRSTELCKLFPEYVPSGKDWGNKTGFSLANRSDFIMSGDNVEAIGINTEVTGRKFHIFKNEDIVTEKSVTNEEQLRQSNAYLESHKSLFMNPSFIIEDYSDTKFHFADATTVLFDDPEVDTLNIPLLYPDPKGSYTWDNKPHSCILPEHFTAEGIGKAGQSGLMKDEGTFNLQYMLNPINPKKTQFSMDMIQTFTSVPEGLNYYLCVDPADSEEKRACYTAMKVIGIDNDDNWYWVDGVFDKIDDHKRINKAIELALKWNVFEVLWENLSFGRTDCRNFERERRKHPSLKAQVREIGADRASKNDRISGLNDRYSRHKIFWPERLMYYSEFEGKVIDIVEAQEKEFINFPLWSHKDLLDAESFMLRIDLIKGDGFKPKESSKYSHIKDPVQRGNTMVFWNDWDEWKKNNFQSPQDQSFNDIDTY